MPDGGGPWPTSSEVSPIASPTTSSTESPTATGVATETLTPLEISQDLEHAENLPFKSFEYLSSTEFAQWVEGKDKTGAFPKFPDTAKPVSSMYITMNPRAIEHGGSDVMFTFSLKDDDANGYNEPKNRPVILAGAWNTEYKGEKAIFILTEWLNKDGTHGFWGYIFKPSVSPPFATKEHVSEEDFVKGLMGNDPLSIASGLYMKDENVCKRALANFDGNPNSTYCDWIFANTKISYPKSTIQHWGSTGILTNTIRSGGKDIPFIPITIPTLASIVGT